MSNMSYCRFQNTVNDLEDCVWALDDGMSDLSDWEFEALGRMIELSQELVKHQKDYFDEQEIREKEKKEGEN